MRKLFFIFFSIYSIYSCSQTWQWAQSGAGYGNQYGNFITIDKYRNEIITGDFTDNSIEFGTKNLYNNGLENIFIVNRILSCHDIYCEPECERN